MRRDHRKMLEFTLSKVPADEPAVRPYAMEALIRHGVDRDQVIAAFGATTPELAQLDDLLAMPAIFA